MDQQAHAKNCLKIILKVEPSDPSALFLRGQANEIRQETSHQAILDYQRAYELLAASGRTRAESNLCKAVEAKLRKAEVWSVDSPTTTNGRRPIKKFPPLKRN